MGASESTRTCPKCGVQFLESNMLIHSRECSKVEASENPDGTWKWIYTGALSGITTVIAAISPASRKALLNKP